MKKVIIFDFDGTIADTLPEVITILHSFSKKYNLKSLTDFEREQLRARSVYEILTYMHVPIYKLPSIVLDVKRELNKRIKHVKPITGISEILEQLKKERYILAIITSNNRNTVKLFLENNNLDVFEYFYTGTTLFGKARIIAKFLRKCSIDNAIYVGDEIRDIEATTKVGIPIVAVTWGYNSKEGLLRLNPTFLIDKPRELPPILEKYFN